jgi:hypothetical protein
MIEEVYKGIRPGLSACPDHLEKPIWVDVEQEIGVTLTEEIWQCGRIFQFLDIILGIRKVSILDLENKEDQVMITQKKRFDGYRKWI